MKRYLWLCSFQVENKHADAKHGRDLQEERVQARESVVQWLRDRFSYYCPGYCNIYSLGSICGMEFFPFVMTVVNWGFVLLQDSWAGFCPVCENNTKSCDISERLVTRVQHILSPPLWKSMS